MPLKSKNKVSPNFNMSSMTDVVFLLLIFFMLTSTLVVPNALDLILPSSKAKTIKNQPASISIEQKDSLINFYINNEQISKQNLESKLKEIMTENDEKGLILYTDKSIAIEHVVFVLDLANKNKYKIVLATNPK